VTKRWLCGRGMGLRIRSRKATPCRIVRRGRRSKVCQYPHRQLRPEAKLRPHSVGQIRDHSRSTPARLRSRRRRGCHGRSSTEFRTTPRRRRPCWPSGDCRPYVARRNRPGRDPVGRTQRHLFLGACSAVSAGGPEREPRWGDLSRVTLIVADPRPRAQPAAPDRPVERDGRPYGKRGMLERRFRR
jgi:hypothetical protein